MMPLAQPPAIVAPAPRVLVLASWYAKGLRNPHAMTVASRDHKRGKKLRLRINPTAHWIHVTVNDYGPDPVLHPERGMDVSLGVAKKLGMVRAGLAVIEIEELP